MKKLAENIMTLVGMANRVENNHYKVGFFHIRFWYRNDIKCDQFNGRGYEVNITNDLTDFNYTLYVKTRHGLYSAITYFYYFTDQTQIDFLNDTMGGYCNYFEKRCITTEYLTEQNENRK